MPTSNVSGRIAELDGKRLLTRDGTTSVGLTAAPIHGAAVAATTRNSVRETLLRQSGALSPHARPPNRVQF
jgi:hypothetical protein